MVAWTGVFIQYRLEWPLHLILNRECMGVYNRLFGFLAHTKRVGFELERVWPALMQNCYRRLPTRDNTWLGPMWSLRANMAFFVTNLTFYLQVDVVEVEYSLLQRTVSAAEDFEGVRRAHNHFLSTLRAKFFLDNFAIKESMRRLLRLVLGFCCLFNLHSDAVDLPKGEVQALKTAFEEEILFIFPTLERLAKELAMRLDYNGHYSNH
ncbi:unnamed protein product [Discosporangium mesarthrocarpum]